jgi:hypothetical protein
VPSKLCLEVSPQLIPALAVLHKANSVNDLSFLRRRLATDLPQSPGELTGT